MPSWEIWNMEIWTKSYHLGHFWTIKDHLLGPSISWAGPGPKKFGPRPIWASVLWAPLGLGQPWAKLIYRPGPIWAGPGQAQTHPYLKLSKVTGFIFWSSYNWFHVKNSKICNTHWVWNIGNFPATQILREINFCEFEVSKSAISTVLAPLNLVIVNFSSAKNYKTLTLCSQMCKNGRSCTSTLPSVEDHPPLKRH